MNEIMLREVRPGQQFWFTVEGMHCILVNPASVAAHLKTHADCLWYVTAMGVLSLSHCNTPVFVRK